MEPFTKEELKNISDDDIIRLFNEKSKRLYPFCLIGLDLDEARQKMKEYNEYVEILTDGDACIMDTRISYYIAKIDNNKIITDLNNLF